MSNSEKPTTRQSGRMKDYDYSLPGFYFVTICIEGHKCVFGEVRNGEMHLNDLGLVAQSMWEDLPRRFPRVQLDDFVIMPNHMHGIIELTPFTGAIDNVLTSVRLQASLQYHSIKKVRLTLGWAVRAFKGVTTYTIHKAGKADFAWQRGFYETLIRDERGLENIRNYIINNPLRWREDSLYK